MFWTILGIYLISVAVIPTMHWRNGTWRRGSDIIISFVIGILVVIMLLIKLVIQIFRWIERV
jgi:hypothetical protein